MFLPHFDVLCDLLLDRCTATWNLFVLYNKEINFLRIKAALFHVRRAKMGPMIYTKWSNPIGCYALAKNCNWFRQIMPLSNWLECGFLWNEILQRRKTWTSKSTILKENARKIESVFCHQISPVSRKAWMLPWILLESKNTLGKLAIAVNLEAIRFAFWTERSVSDGGNLCPLWSVILKSIWNSVEDTF